jgi:hypothetical protein
MLLLHNRERLQQSSRLSLLVKKLIFRSWLVLGEFAVNDLSESFEAGGGEERGGFELSMDERGDGEEEMDREREGRGGGKSAVSSWREGSSRRTAGGSRFRGRVCGRSVRDGSKEKKAGGTNR